MPAANLQTVIVPKSILTARGEKAQRSEARELAREHANRIYTSRQTSTSYRFRQRPLKDFKKGTKYWSTYEVPDSDGIKQVFGTLKTPRKKTKRKAAKRKKAANPAPTKPHMRDWWFLLDSAKKATTLEGLSTVAQYLDDFSESPVMRQQLAGAVSERANQLGFPCGDWPIERCVDWLRRRYPTEGPPMQERQRWLDPEDLAEQQRLRLFGAPDEPEENPGRRLSPNPKVMMDPGACAWLGSLLEWKWKKGKKEVLWEPDGEMLFLWSTTLRAVIAVPHPKAMRKRPKVSRKDGGAKMAERFLARPASNTYAIKIPRVPLKRLGKAIHIVYRSDKWNPPDEVDYIHDFGKGVNLFCGPSLRNPKVFLCFGGRLTTTERGLVY